jgi:hypothetical protein
MRRRADRRGRFRDDRLRGHRLVHVAHRHVVDHLVLDVQHQSERHAILYMGRYRNQSALFHERGRGSEQLDPARTGHRRGGHGWGDGRLVDDDVRVRRGR